MAKLLPYFEDKCRTESSTCQMYLDYTDFCLDNRDWILDDDNRSQNDFINVWTEYVSTNFSLNVQELRQIYKSNSE